MKIYMEMEDDSWRFRMVKSMPHYTKGGAQELGRPEISKTEVVGFCPQMTTSQELPLMPAQSLVLEFKAGCCNHQHDGAGCRV
jgi:hypothetical protein